MEEEDLTFIQEQIGYHFANPDLLRQAFTRRSYSQERGGADNEVLEFIGDKVLDITVIRYLMNRFGYRDETADSKEFHSDCNEGELTRLKSQMVEKKTLADMMDQLDLAQFLILGKGDIRNNIADETSVKEDLFEAILGAVALDSEWDFKILQSVMEVMLDPDSFFDSAEENYVQLVQDWTLKEYGVFPQFKFPDSNHCILIMGDDLPRFRSAGVSKNEARKNACQAAYSWLDGQGLLFTIRDEIEDPNQEEAINQLETLARRGYFLLPVYEFTEGHDPDGNPLWTAVCRIDGDDYWHIAKASSKKEAKKMAAYGMLMHVLGYDDEEED